MSQVFEGYMFMTSGCEHGPTIMLREDQWDEGVYKTLKADSWCANEFNIHRQEDDFAKYLGPEFTPGVKYRLTIEEIE